MKKRNYLLWFWRIIYPMIVYFVISYLVQIIFAIAYMKTAMTETNGDLLAMQEYVMERLLANSLPFLLISAVITFPLFFYLMRHDHRKRQMITGIITYEQPTSIQYVLIVILAVLFCQSINTLIEFSRIIERFPGYTDVAELLYGGGVPMELLVVGIAAPVVEEMLFRGLVHKRIREYCRPGLAIVLSGLIFGIYHLNVVQGIYAALLGIVLGYLYEKFHTIFVPIAFHIAANIMSLLFTEVPFFQELFANQVVVLMITAVSIPISAMILLKFRRTEQAYTMELPESGR